MNDQDRRRLTTARKELEQATEKMDRALGRIYRSDRPDWHQRLIEHSSGAEEVLREVEAALDGPIGFSAGVEAS